MNKVKQNGSIHGVLIVILVLALIGALGFIFWQNFMKQNVAGEGDTKTTTSTTPPPSQSPTLTTVSFSPAFSVGLKFSYPQDWTIERTTDGPFPLDESVGYSQETIIVTSPSKKVTVKYVLAANGGLGGTCMPEEVGTLATITATPIASFDGTSFAQYSTTAKGYKYFSGIASTAMVGSLKAGDSLCKVYLADIIQLQESDNTQLLEAKIHVASLDEDTGMPKDSVTSFDIETAYKSDDYKTAVDILLSTTLTE